MVPMQVEPSDHQWKARIVVTFTGRACEAGYASPAVYIGASASAALWSENGDVEHDPPEGD